MGGNSSQISTTKFLGTNATGSQYMVAAAISVLNGAKDGFVALGNETVVKALKKADLLRQEQNVDAFDTAAGVFTGVAALGTDTVMTFTPPANTITGTTWTSGIIANRLPAVKQVYDTITTHSGFTFNDAERAHLLQELLIDFASINSTFLSAANWMSIENYVSKAVWKQYAHQYVFTASASATSIGVAAPLHASGLRSRMTDTSKTDAQREAAWDALYVLLFDLVELTSNSSTVTSSAIVNPGVASGSNMKPVFETVLDVGTFSTSADILVFFKAFFDLDIIADMELNALALPVSISPTMFSQAIGGLIAYAGTFVAQYSASANSVSNMNEISLSASNALKADGDRVRPLLNHPRAELNTVIGQLSSIFNAEIVMLEALADPTTRSIGPTLKNELELAGISGNLVENYLFKTAQLQGRQIIGELVFLMYDANGP